MKLLLTSIICLTVVCSSKEQSITKKFDTKIDKAKNVIIKGGNNTVQQADNVTIKYDSTIKKENTTQVFFKGMKLSYDTLTKDYAYAYEFAPSENYIGYYRINILLKFSDKINPIPRSRFNVKDKPKLFDVNSVGDGMLNYKYGYDQDSTLILVTGQFLADGFKIIVHGKTNYRHTIISGVDGQVKN